VKKSAIETGNHEMFPGAPWINIDYNEQLTIKQSQVEEALFHCRKYQEEIPFLPIVPMENTFGYRNKIEFSF
jgi:tRNA/tmRNA/rRNA uracil-C5-methylase (TrmA/RlmC/RlmD family)